MRSNSKRRNFNRDTKEFALIAVELHLPLQLCVRVVYSMQKKKKKQIVCHTEITMQLLQTRTLRYWIVAFVYCLLQILLLCNSWQLNNGRCLSIACPTNKCIFHCGGNWQDEHLFSKPRETKELFLSLPFWAINDNGKRKQNSFGSHSGEHFSSSQQKKRNLFFAKKRQN